MVDSEVQIKNKNNMKLTNQEIFGLNKLLESIKDVPASFTFNYGMKKNKNKFRSVLRSQPLQTPPQGEEYKKFIEDFRNANKNTIKNPKEMEQLFEVEINKEENKLIKEQRDIQIAKYNKDTEEWANKTIEIPIYTVPSETFPDGLTAEQFEIMFDYFCSNKPVEEKEEETKTKE